MTVVASVPNSLIVATALQSSASDRWRKLLVVSARSAHDLGNRRSTRNLRNRVSPPTKSAPAIAVPTPACGIRAERGTVASQQILERDWKTKSDNTDAILRLIFALHRSAARRAFGSAW